MVILEAVVFIFNNPQNSACKVLSVICHMVPLPPAVVYLENTALDVNTEACPALPRLWIQH